MKGPLRKQKDKKKKKKKEARRHATRVREVQSKTSPE